MNWKFHIKYGNPEVRTELKPRFSELLFTQEVDEDFGYSRKKLNTAITLVGKDYDLIFGFSFGESFIIDIEKQDFDNTYKPYYSTKCFKNKGVFDEDHRLIELKLDEVIDQYTEFLAGFDKKFNILDLPLNTKILNLSKRGLLQIYMTSLAEIGQTVFNFLGGNYWESEAINPTGESNILVNSYNFIALPDILIMAPDVGIDVTVSFGNFILNTALVSTYEGYSNGTIATITKEIVGPNGKWTIKENGTPTFQTAFEPDFTSIIDMAFQNLSNSEVIYLKRFTPYVRMLTDLSSIYAVPSVSITEIDIVDPVNYGYSWSNVILEGLEVVGSMQKTTSLGDWGIIKDGFINEGDYYKKYDYVDGFDNPVVRSMWNYYSFWLKSSDMTILESDSSIDVTVNDNYTLGGAIIALLSATNSNVNFEENETFSQFLYAVNNPITNEPNPLLLLTPKTNVLNGEYTKPATKGNASLKELLLFLKLTHNCSFYIDENSNLIIEQERFFVNGGSYSPVENIYADLIQIKNKNTKNYAYGLNKYEFEKDKLLDEFNFVWGDDMSFIFSGFPVKSVGEFVQRGLVEYPNVGNFMPDIDYINSNAADVNKDGFVISGAFLVSGNTYEIPIVETVINSATYYLQNGYLANPYLHENYFKDNANSPNLLINEAATTAISVKKIKVQTDVIFPSFNFDLPQPFDLIRTELGDGKPYGLEYNGITNETKTNLRYEFD